MVEVQKTWLQQLFSYLSERWPKKFVWRPYLAMYREDWQALLSASLSVLRVWVFRDLTRVWLGGLWPPDWVSLQPDGGAGCAWPARDWEAWQAPPHHQLQSAQTQQFTHPGPGSGSFCVVWSLEQEYVSRLELTRTDQHQHKQRGHTALHSPHTPWQCILYTTALLYLNICSITSTSVVISFERLCNYDNLTNWSTRPTSTFRLLCFNVYSISR